MTDRSSVQGALAAVLARGPCSHERALQLMQQVGVVGDELDRLCEQLGRWPDTAVARGGCLLAHGQPVGELNLGGIALLLAQQAAQASPAEAIDQLLGDLQRTSVLCHSTVIAGGPCPSSTLDIGNGISLIPYRPAQTDPIWKVRLSAIAPEENFIEASAPSCLWSKVLEVPLQVSASVPPWWNGYAGKMPHQPWGPYVTTFEPAVHLTALQRKYLPQAYPIVHWIQPHDPAFRFKFTYLSAFALNKPAPPVLIDASVADDLRTLNIACALDLLASTAELSSHRRALPLSEQFARKRRPELCQESSTAGAGSLTSTSWTAASI